MKAELFPFQKRALGELRMKSAEAVYRYQRTHSKQVVSFTAPTGAGKTIIMAALIESIFFGDEAYPEQPEAIVVWLSDSPQLNEQSKDKIDLKADKIRLGQCVTIQDDSFDQEMFDDGHIYFLNTRSARVLILQSIQIIVSTQSGRPWRIQPVKRATVCISSLMKRIVECRAVKPDVLQQSCRSSLKEVRKTELRLCR